MEKLISYCGINCATCPLYVATVNEDILKKQELALKWETLYRRSFSLEEMKCYGCKSGKKFFLSNKCDITPCNKDKQINTCSECQDHSCERIEKFYEWQKINNTEVEIIR